MRSWIRPFSIGLALVLLGVWIGGILFSSTQQRSVLAIRRCKTCLRTSELFGLITSVGVQLTPGFIPDVLIESDKAISIRSPRPLNAFHAVVFPKKDIKDLEDISAEDQSYVMECLGMLAQIARTYHLKKYQITTNSSTLQEINYLHFHLISPEVGRL